ncbi:MAG: DUF1425 domain-containing protein [Phycisphaerae bacterium]
MKYNDFPINHISHRIFDSGRGVAAIAAAALVCLLLSGCQGPVVPYADSLSPYPQIHLTSYSLQGKILVKEPIVSRVGGGQLNVVVPVRNLTDHTLYLQYQYAFLDSRGVMIEGRSGWMDLRIPPYAMAQAHFTSMTPEAMNFDLDISRLQ